MPVIAQTTSRLLVSVQGPPHLSCFFPFLDDRRGIFSFRTNDALVGPYSIVCAARGSGGAPAIGCPHVPPPLHCPYGFSLPNRLTPASPQDQCQPDVRRLAPTKVLSTNANVGHRQAYCAFTFAAPNLFSLLPRSGTPPASHELAFQIPPSDEPAG